MENQRKLPFIFPIELKRLIKSLGDDNQWKILELLINENNKLSYSEIQKKTQIQKGTLNYHLKELQKSGWLRRWTGIVSEEEKSLYEISAFGLKVLEGALQAMKRQSYDVDLLRSITDNQIIDLAGQEQSKWFELTLVNELQSKIIEGTLPLVLSSTNKPFRELTTTFTIPAIDIVTPAHSRVDKDAVRNLFGFRSAFVHHGYSKRKLTEAMDETRMSSEEQELEENRITIGWKRSRKREY